MTRRERLEAKMAKREEWAEGREAKATDLRNATPGSVRHDWAFITQPGHIPERARMIRRDDKAREHDAIARHHATKADGLAQQLDRTIFSDDPDAVEALEAKLAKLRADQGRDKAQNAYYRKHKTMKGCPGLSDEAAARVDADIPTRYSWEQKPVRPYEITNRGAEIRRAEKRIEEVKLRQQRTSAAESSDTGFTIEGAGDYVRVTFAEKPARDTLNALREAGFRWGAGSWTGRRDALPVELATPEVSR
jgi:hypothetical protein